MWVLKHNDLYTQIDVDKGPKAVEEKKKETDGQPSQWLRMATPSKTLEAGDEDVPEVWALDHPLRVEGLWGRIGRCARARQIV